MGTKLKPKLFALRKYDTVGYDLVNHCVNVYLVQGAKPFFLDYIGAASVNPELIEAVVSVGLVKGSPRKRHGVDRGETAEMPGMYAAGEFDLVVGLWEAVERKN